MGTFLCKILIFGGSKFWHFLCLDLLQIYIWADFKFLKKIYDFWQSLPVFNANSAVIHNDSFQTCSWCVSDSVNTFSSFVI